MSRSTAKEKAEREIQKRLAKMLRDFEKVRKIADEHQIEFEFLGSKMHYRSYYDYYNRKKKAQTGFFIAEALWQSSGMGCEEYEDAATGTSFNQWYRANWPEDFDPEDESE